MQELLSSCRQTNSSDPATTQQLGDIHYFVVDCRPPDQYNNGHFLTAFHLDCSLVSGLVPTLNPTLTLLPQMLNDPSAFSTAVQALLASQQQAIDAKSVAGGEHLCFIGSGRGDEDDSYVHMVVASFLQKRHKYVSLLYGGYQSLHRYILDNRWDHYLVDHNQIGRAHV